MRYRLSTYTVIQQTLLEHPFYTSFCSRCPSCSDKQDSMGETVIKSFINSSKITIVVSAT